MRQFVLEWSFTQAFGTLKYSQLIGVADHAVGSVKSLWYNSANKDGAMLAYHNTLLKFGISTNQFMSDRAVQSTVGNHMSQLTMSHMRKLSRVTGVNS